MTAVGEPKHPALRSLYWREEVLEVMLWLRGGGYDDRLDAAVLADFLGIDRTLATGHLERLADQGYLRLMPGDGRYALTPLGEEEAQRLVGGLRAVPLASPGRCGPACWCSTSRVESWHCASSTFT